MRCIVDNSPTLIIEEGKEKTRIHSSTKQNCGSRFPSYYTTKILVPILPYLATTYDAVLTTMINFQDALKQKGDTFDALWADEGEIQLIKPDQFSNIFLGLGGFQNNGEDCVGLSWCLSGIFSVLVETECYGTDVIKSVISGSHYTRAHTAHSMIHEVLSSMMLEAFLSKFPEKRIELEDHTMGSTFSMSLPVKNGIV